MEKQRIQSIIQAILNDIVEVNERKDAMTQMKMSNDKDDKLERLKDEQYQINALAMRELDPDNRYKHDNFVEIQKQPTFPPVINSRLYIEDKSNFNFIIASLDFDTHTNNNAKPNDKIEVQSKLLNSIAKEYTQSYGPQTHEQKQMEYMFSNADPKAIERFNKKLANEYTNFPGDLDHIGKKLGDPFTYDMKNHQLIATKEIDNIVLKRLNETHYHTSDRKNEFKHYEILDNILDKIGTNANNLNSTEDMSDFIHQQLKHPDIFDKTDVKRKNLNSMDDKIDFLNHRSRQFNILNKISANAKNLNSMNDVTDFASQQLKYFDILDKIGANAKNLNSMDDITDFINSQLKMESENQNNNKFEPLSLNLDGLQEQNGLIR